MNSKSDNSCMQGNTTASDDDAFMKYIANNRTSFRTFEKLKGLQSFCKKKLITLWPTPLVKKR